MSARETFLAHTRSILWRAWSTSSEELGSAAVDTLMGLGMLVPEGGAAELAAYRALELGITDGRVSAACEDPDHPTWLRKADDTRGCPWCRVAELEAALAPNPDPPHGFVREHQGESDAKRRRARCKYCGKPSTDSVHAVEERHTIGLDVDEDSPAADLALRLRGSQPDVTHTNVRTGTALQVTVRPQSADCLRWWLGRFEADPSTGTYADGEYTVRGHRGDVAVDLTIVGDAVDACRAVMRHAS